MTNEEFFDKYPEIVVYDFEVFPKYWCMVAVSKDTPGSFVIESRGNPTDDSQILFEEAWRPNKDKVWVGYNSNHYDRYIFGAIYHGFPQKDLYRISQKLVSGKQVSNDILVEGMISYDTGNFFRSLKELEAFMGHSIEESSVPFDHPEELTEEQKSEVIQYCRHDVLETLEVLKRTIHDYTAQRDVIQTFDLPRTDFRKTKAQLTATVLGCSKWKVDVDLTAVQGKEVRTLLDFSGEEWNQTIVDCVKLDRYRQALEFYSTSENYRDNQKLKMDVMGVPHVFGLGGAHGARKKYHQAGGQMWHIDVTSYYPSIMIQHDMLTRRAEDPELFKQIYDTRVRLKAEGKKQEQQPYKIILNATFGITNQEASKAYDPKKNHDVCINGQLMLLMLLEMLEGKCTLIQSNTDGIIISARGYEWDKIKAVCDEWCRITRMSVGYDEIDEIWQKDVNNYLFRFANGKYEAKGAYVKFNGDLDNDMAVLNEAVRAGLIANDIEAVDAHIDACTDLTKFQKVVKLSSKYRYAYYGGNRIEHHKCFRVFAVNGYGEIIGKQKQLGATIEKFANTPERSTIVFGDLSDEDLVDYAGDPFDISMVDKDYYKNLARKRYSDFVG